VPLDEPEIDGTKNDSMSAKSQGDSEDPDESEPGGDGDSGDESDNEIIDLEQEMVGSKTFAERMTEHIQGLREFADGLEYQLQFNDSRMLDCLEREGRAFFRFSQSCLNQERHMNSTRGPRPATWEREMASVMFYRTRPAN
jgi:hypothetical protein